MHTSRSAIKQLAQRIRPLPGLLCTALLCACASSTPSTPAAFSTAADQPTDLAGTLSYTNDILTSYSTRHAVALVDMHGFVRHDRDWPIRNQSLVFGSLALDQDEKSGSYHIFLPSRPPGVLSDADHDPAHGQGVKVFAVAYWSDPFEANHGTKHGWPTFMTSTQIDAEREDEVTGGKLVVWSPDDQQQFPTGFGPDQRLFTDDDPLGPLEAGYSVIDLNSTPFTIDRSHEPQLPLNEESSLAVKDYASLSYRIAFERMFADLRRDYAFNGIDGKAPDWDALYNRIQPRIVEAEQQRDPQAFYLALREFVASFHDGHITLDGGDLQDHVFEQQSGGGYGFAIRALENGQYIVVYTLEGGPAAQAGISKGAQITAFNGQPIAAAVAAVQPPTAPFSTEYARQYDQQRYLLRAPIGSSAQITFANPGKAAQTVTLQSVDERKSLSATSLYHESDPTALPVEYRVLESGLGYVRINSNDDDLDLIDELFVRALDSFEYHEVPGVIVDLRHNDGGSPLYLAGYLADKPIPLAQLEYYSEATKRFEADGEPDAITPIEKPYHFGKLALLVDQACFSACEIEAYGFSKLPGALVVGQYPTAGVEAEVARGQFELPEDIWLQAPTGRYVLPDGTLFLEGAGVAPTLRVPLDAPTLLSDQDTVLQAAERALLK